MSDAYNGWASFGSLADFYLQKLRGSLLLFVFRRFM